ncbi:MAG: hypothetical protein JO112_02325 [Planctomycetes bacterium]|nr:hypothetical protein [Planctomycetota bacterium]
MCKKDSKPVVSAGGKCGKEVIEKRLLTPISINFRETSLLQVLKELGAAHHLNIVADESALEEAGISLDRPLTVKLEDVELKSVLGLLLEMTHHHLAYVIQDGAVVVTTRARTHGKVVGKTYNVEDLESFHLNGQPWNPEEIIKFIIENIEPESWRCLGGAGTIDYFPLSKALVVNQPADIQEQVMDVLTSLRRLKGEPDLPPAPGLAMDMPLWTPPLLPVPYPVPFLAFPPLPPMPPPPPEPGFHMVQGVPPVRGIYGPMMPELLPAPRLLQQPAIPVQEARQVRECPAFNGEFLYHYQARPEHNGQGSPEFLYFHPLFRNASQGKAEVVDTASNGPATGMWVERRDLTPPPMPPLSDFRAGIAPATCVAPAVGVPSSEAERPSTHSSGGHSDSWTMKVVLEEGHALLEVQGPGESRLTCERTTLKNSGGSPLKIHVAENDTQVAVSSSALNALADSLIEQNGCLVLEGHVKLVYSKDTQRADVVADRVLINLASGNLEIAPGTCTTPQAGSEAMQKANFSFWVGTFH